MRVCKTWRSTALAALRKPPTAGGRQLFQLLRPALRTMGGVCGPRTRSSGPRGPFQLWIESKDDQKQGYCSHTPHHT